MKTRYKKVSEFMKRIQIVEGANGGIKLMCRIKTPYVLLESKYKPWNTPATRRSFLLKLYISEMLWKINVSKKIQRIEGFELLGKRVMHYDLLSVIIDAQDMVDERTGEMTKQITITNNLKTAPFKTMITDIQL